MNHRMVWYADAAHVSLVRVLADLGGVGDMKKVMFPDGTVLSVFAADLHDTKEKADWWSTELRGLGEMKHG